MSKEITRHRQDFHANKNVFTGRNSRIHSFKQYHFQDWPDFGIPDSSKSLVAFVDFLRGHEEADLQRVVVKFKRNLFLLFFQRCQHTVINTGSYYLARYNS